MSAFLVGPHHTMAVAQAFANENEPHLIYSARLTLDRYHEPVSQDIVPTRRIAKILAGFNWDNCAHLARDSEGTTYYTMANRFAYVKECELYNARPIQPLSDANMVGAISCLSYQCCDAPSWIGSLGEALLAILYSEYANKLSRKMGGLLWHLNDDFVDPDVGMCAATMVLREAGMQL